MGGVATSNPRIQLLQLQLNSHNPAETYTQHHVLVSDFLHAVVFSQRPALRVTAPATATATSSLVLIPPSSCLCPVSPRSPLTVSNDDFNNNGSGKPSVGQRVAGGVEQLGESPPYHTIPCHSTSQCRHLPVPPSPRPFLSFSTYASWAPHAFRVTSDPR